MTRSILSSLFFLLLLQSCQQDFEIAVPTDPDHPNPPATPDVSLVHTVQSPSGEDKYTYDTLHRFTSATYSDGFSTAEYFDSLIILAYYEPDSTLDYFNTFELNSQGLVKKRTVSNNSSYAEWHEYDSKGRITRTTAVNGNDTFEKKNYYSGVNLDSTVYYQNNTHRYTYYYTYYTGHRNTLDHEAYGQPYRGHESQDVIKNWYGKKPDGQIFIQVLFTYTYDAKDRVISQTQYYNDSITTFHYTYID